MLENAYAATTPYATVIPGDPAQLAARPSRPNYLYLFSASNQGVLPRWFQLPQSPYLGTVVYSENGKKLPAPLESVPVRIVNNLVPAERRPFTTPNPGAAIIAAGGTLASLSESLPYPPGTATSTPRRTCTGASTTRLSTGSACPASEVPKRAARFVLPLETNLGFLNTVDPTDGKKYRGFAVDAVGRPIGYEQLPTVALVVPNEHNGEHSASIAAADAWLVANIRPYADWARANNSLQIVTFDADGAENIGPPHTIPTLLVGSPERVSVGSFRQTMDHLNILATVLDLYGALETFQADFAAAFDSAEAQRAAANLLPSTGVISTAQSPAPSPLTAADAGRHASRYPTGLRRPS